MRLTLLAAALLLATGCATQPGESEPAHGVDGWTRLPDPPLSPREGSVAAYVGGEAVFVGGYAGPPCPPNADCVYPEDTNRADGAAYDPAAGTWRPIADAPRPVPAWAPSAVVGDSLYVLVDRTLLAWDSAEDAWTQLHPPRDPGWSVPVADGDRLVLAAGSDENGVLPDQVLDPTTGRWSKLPPDPLKPSFDRLLTATPAGLVLTAKPIAADGGPADPALVHAALLPRGAATWRPLPTSEQLGGWRWTWTGERLVDPTLGGADGGEVNGYGRVIPFGGRLDPVRGDWSPLPDPPAEGTGGWPVEALDGPLAAADGWLYDDDAGSWTRLTRPDDAPAEPGPAAWAGGTLIVCGGTDYGDRGPTGRLDHEEVRSTSAWALRTP